MKKNIMVMLFIGIFCTAIGQVRTFEKDMKASLYIHDTASVVSSEFKSLSAFEGLIKKYPKEWLPSFWASYMCTQIARLTTDPLFPKDMSAKQLLEKSQKYIDISKNIKRALAVEDSTSFHVLQGFIYSFFRDSTLLSAEDKGKDFDSLMNREYCMAALQNPLENNLSVIFAIGLARKKEVTFKEAQTAFVVLSNAKAIASKITNRGMTTFWSADFLNFWKAKVEEILRNLISNDAD